EHIPLKNSVSATELAGLKRTAVRFSLPADAWPAIIQLWISGEVDFVHLLWWQKDDPETRMLIVALDWCSSTIPPAETENWPAALYDYEKLSRKFNDAERASRTAEAAIVRKNHELLAQKLGALFEKHHLLIANSYQPRKSNSPR